ncbi:MAG: pilus assembly protein TadG [Burkholderiales bacterium RIFCSPHIGHO2_12_FULL_61_11]|nr:MAG: pilus assembly protein TadG [Burkholderiales bacterium RIFCSPHIGHO2_12_FULL_61_11]
MNTKKMANQFKQRGVAAVEFALIALIFFMILIGVMEMSRVLFYMNTAGEVTRLGARLAVVCDVGDPIVETKMINMLNILTAPDISVGYNPTGCTSDTCQSVTVSVTKSINTFIPLVPLTFTMPSFSTTLPRESLNSATNPVCS